MGNKEKKAEEVDVKTVEAVQESLNYSHALEGTDDDNEISRKIQAGKNRSDRAGVSSHDHISGTDGFETSERKEKADAPRKKRRKLSKEQDRRRRIPKEAYEKSAPEKRKGKYGGTDVINELYNDDEEDEMEKKDTRRKRRRRDRKHKKGGKVAAITLGGILAVLALAYLGIALYFNSHFLFFTKINGTDFSMKNVEQVEDYMKKQVSDYTLALEKSDGGHESIDGSDIAIEYVSGKKKKKIK